MTLRVRVFSLRERWRMSLWLIPALGVVAAAALAAVLLGIDRSIGHGAPTFLFRGGADSARNLLSVIAGSMVTSISLIFSVTMVVLQLASAQYSPRVLRWFIRDRLVQLVLAAYIATFVYCLLILPSLRPAGDGQPEFVPATAVTAALVLALLSLGLFVRYVHHIAHSIRAVTVINKVAAEAREELERLYPESMGDEADAGTERPTGAPTEVMRASGSIPRVSSGSSPRGSRGRTTCTSPSTRSATTAAGPSRWRAGWPAPSRTC